MAWELSTFAASLTMLGMVDLPRDTALSLSCSARLMKAKMAIVGRWAVEERDHKDQRMVGAGGKLLHLRVFTVQFCYAVTEGNAQCNRN